MRRSRRKLLARGAGLLGVGALAAACGVGGGGDKIAQGKSDREVTIRWSTWDNSKGNFNTDAAPKGMAIFNQKFPKVKVTIEPQDGDWTTKNQTEWVAGTGPDMSGHCCTNGVQWARDGLFIDLTPRIAKDFPQKIREDFVEWLIKRYQIPGIGQFALPMYSGALALFYNKTLFQKKGVAFPDDTWDWNKYRDAAVKLTDPTNHVYGRRQIRGIDRLMQRVHQAGGTWVDPNDDTKPAFDSAATLQALQYERDANLKDKVTGYQGEYNDTQGMDIWGAISAQRWGMWEDGSWVLVRQSYLVDKEVVPQWDVAPVPKGPKQRDTLVTHDGWAIWKGSKYPDEAWELMKFLEGDEWMEIASSIVGHQPARKSFQDRWARLIKEANPLLADKNLKPFTDAIQQNYARPKEFFKKNQTDAEKIINEALNVSVYATETATSIKNGEAALDATIKDAARRVAEITK